MLHSDDHFLFEGSNRSRLGVNVTPLIDVVFLLLIFFMLTTSFLEPQAIVLQFPELKESKAPTKDVIIVSIGIDHVITLNGETSTLGDLPGKISALLTRHPERSVIIQAARKVPVQKTIEVMDQVRAAGSDNIRFLTGVK